MHQLFHGSDTILFAGLIIIVSILLLICIFIAYLFLVVIEENLYFVSVNKQVSSFASLTLLVIFLCDCSFQK